jgi:DNA-binding XRE family transcriptional regulator
VITPAQVRAARALIGWTQVDLAQASGVSEITIKNLERGATDPRIGTMNSIERAFDLARLPSRKALSVPSSRADGAGPSGPHLAARHPQCQGKHVEYISEAGDIVVMHHEVLTRLATEDSL